MIPELTLGHRGAVRGAPQPASRCGKGGGGRAREAWGVGAGESRRLRGLRARAGASPPPACPQRSPGPGCRRAVLREPRPQTRAARCEQRQHARAVRVRRGASLLVRRRTSVTHSRARRLMLCGSLRRGAARRLASHGFPQNYHRRGLLRGRSRRPVRSPGVPRT